MGFWREAAASGISLPETLDRWRGAAIGDSPPALRNRARDAGAKAS
ncbi:hypothetical protein NE575_04700 [Clostridium sp. SL.3.18]|nr:hypothetical protein [Clostridium sp. SL.3.18]